MGWVELEYTTAGVESCSVEEEEDDVVVEVVLWWWWEGAGTWEEGEMFAQGLMVSCWDIAGEGRGEAIVEAAAAKWWLRWLYAILLLDIIMLCLYYPPCVCVYICLREEEGREGKKEGEGERGSE